MKQNILLGWYKGDGNLRMEKGRPKTYQITTISQRLVYDMKLLISTLNLIPNIRIEKAWKNHRESYRLQMGINQGMKILGENHRMKTDYSGTSKRRGEFLTMPVKKIEQAYYEGLVYNLTTNHETFLTKSFMVHNCGCRLRTTPRGSESRKLLIVKRIE